MPGTSTLTGTERSTELKGQEIRSKMMMQWRGDRCMLTAVTAKTVRLGGEDREKFK